MYLMLAMFMMSLVYANTCEEVMSGHIATVTFSGEPLVACGESEKGIVSDLTVIHGKKIVFEEDGTFKNYKVLTTKNAMYIDEGLSSSIVFKPFIQRRFKCMNGKCLFHDVKCLWIKEKPDNEIAAEIKKYQTKKQTVPDTSWEKALVSALNGNKEVLELFKNNSESSEGFITYKNDFYRLQKLGCIPAL